MIAAMMTAANMGARTTGWGFVVFTGGSVCWAAIGLSTGQVNLLATNLFLTLVNVVGIWRWLGRQAKYQDGAQSAAIDSESRDGPSLTPSSSLCGLPVTDCQGAALGECVEALIDRDKGQIDYIVVASRNALGLEEQLRGVPRARFKFADDQIRLALETPAFNALPVLRDRQWPSKL
ncbi:MAG: PRC-barrel domain-containing protein [Sandarakinorhabdus sp.]|nr:PRC-barrel domain-containing protein [Sandarakinorhabdus sp.]